ncbi:MAG: hypothetical protein JXR61_10945 [Prolixibacteraceae bacterium]|nr:hypothetical protein [Prolixibacteraceae bacterium]
MIEKEIQFRKRREVGEIITDSLKFLRNEYKPILKLVTIYVLPFIVLYAIVQIQVQQKFLGKIDLTDTENLMANIGPFYKNLFTAGIFSLFVQSLLISTYYSYVEAYIKKGKENFKLSDITPLLFSNGLMALKANLLLFLIVITGFLLCILPGLYFANTLSIVVVVYMFERKGISGAFLRTAFLVNSQWGNTLVLNLLAIIIIWLAGYILSIPTLFMGVDLTSTAIIDIEQIPLQYWIVSGVASVISSVLWIIPYTFWAFQYFNLDERTKINLPPTV